MQTSLEKIAEKARINKKHRFQNLYTMLNEDFLIENYKSLNKRAASGVDKVSTKAYGENLEENVHNLVDRLKKKNYKAKLVRRHYIPKSNGKLRPLGIPATEDKLLQNGVSQILQSIYEEDFLETSYGYRPKIGALDAVKDIRYKTQFGGFGYVVEADIKGFFDNISHDWLIQMLEERVDDRAFLRLIRKWLNAGVLDTNGEIIQPEGGTPQGGLISPVLANIYLHYSLDLWFNKVVLKYLRGVACCIRYADDFICLFRYKEDAQRFFEVLPKRLKKFNLEVAEDKTKMIEFNSYSKSKDNWFEFLGFEFRWGVSRKGKKQIKVKTSKKKLKNSLKNFTEWCKKNRHLKLRELIRQLNSKLRGYYNYYGIIGNYQRMDNFFNGAMLILMKWLNRRSQRKGFLANNFFSMYKAWKIEKPRITEVIKKTVQLSF